MYGGSARRDAGIVGKDPTDKGKEGENEALRRGHTSDANIENNLDRVMDREFLSCERCEGEDEPNREASYGIAR